MRNFIKYLSIYLILGIFSIISAYKILVVEKRIYNEYNGKIGKVEWVTFAPRSAVYLCGIRLKDGTYGEVNGGNYPFKVGDYYKNNIYYDYVMGISGLAYCVLPESAPSEFWGLIYIFLFIVPIAYLLITFIIIKPIEFWIDKF